MQRNTLLEQEAKIAFTIDFCLKYKTNLVGATQQRGQWKYDEIAETKNWLVLTAQLQDNIAAVGSIRLLVPKKGLIPYVAF